MRELIIILCTVTLLILILFFFIRFRRCPKDKIMVVYGLYLKNKKGEKTLFVCIPSGGGRFIWPLIQDYDYLNLNPVRVEIKLKNAETIDNKFIDIDVAYTVVVSIKDDILSNAAQYLLGRTQDEIKILIEDIFYGILRLIISNVTYDSINLIDNALLLEISNKTEEEINKIGLELSGVNIKYINKK